MEELIGWIKHIKIIKMNNPESVITHNGDLYHFHHSSGKVRIFMSDDDRICLITDMDNNIQFEIRAKTICNSAFLNVTTNGYYR